MNILFESENFMITTSGKWYELRLNDGVENPIIMSFNRNTPYLLSFMESSFESLKDELGSLMEEFVKEPSEEIPGFEGTMKQLGDITSVKDNH